jgi:peptidoglycan/LPS O-acetylase OafA/YrhL
MVFGQHYLQLPWGWSGVDLFFVLSGFLITGILLDTRSDRHRVRNFYLRRTLRIFPLFYGIMAALLLLEPLARWNWSWNWVVWPIYVANFARFVHPYTAGDATQRLADFQPQWSAGHHHILLFLGHFWSLCVEEQFYLIWPWLVFWIKDRRKLFALCAVAFPACLGMRLAGQHLLPQWMLDNEILYRATPFRLDALLTGALIAVALRWPAKQAILRLARQALPFVFVLAILWALFTPTAHLWQRPYLYPAWKFTWGLSAIDFIAALLILVAIQPASFAFRVLSLRPMRWIGRISYGAYVLHDIPHMFYALVATKLVWYLDLYMHVSAQTRQYVSTLLAAAVGLGATLILAWLSYRFYETPFLNLKERWTIGARGESSNPVKHRSY